MSVTNTAADYFSTGPHIEVRVDDGTWWATCPGCPTFTAWAGSYSDLFGLIADWHGSPEAPHRGWTMTSPLVMYPTKP